jgi:carboxyl-terminal processing protease
MKRSSATNPAVRLRRPARASSVAVLYALLSMLCVRRARADDGPYSVVERFADVLVYIEEAYVDPVDRARLLEGATSGMVAELDPHSAYLTPAQFSQFIEDTQGEFAGLGVEVDFRDDRVVVVATMPDSPAERAGILPADRIVAVDSVAISGFRADAIVRRMRGPAGTKVRLTIRREGKPEPIHLTLTRAIVNVPSAEGKLLDGNVGYIRLKSFQEGSYVELLEQVANLRRGGKMNGIVLDLRGNPGGLVSEAVAIADELLDRGIIYSARHRGKVVETVESRSGGLLENLPLVVLVGAATASSAEIVTGALQDRGRALVVGEPTFGKGSVQNVIELPGGAGLLLTTLRYFTPKGRAIQARGLIPDVLVKSDDSRGAIREADIAGHLHTEGIATDANAEHTTRPAGAAKPDPSVAGKPVEAPRSAASSDASGDTSVEPKATRYERTPITRVPSNPTKGNDAVLAKGYELLLGRAVR